MTRNHNIHSLNSIKKDKKELNKLCKIFEDIFYVRERKNPPWDGQWTLGDLSDMSEIGRQIVSIIRYSLH